MPNITLTIPTELMAEIGAATETTTQAQFKAHLREYVITRVKEYRLKQAFVTAQQAALDASDLDAIS